jgi:hypothetical protein
MAWQVLRGRSTESERAEAVLRLARTYERFRCRAGAAVLHTVNTHLRSIFAKLDLHLRVQLANAWNARPPNRRHASPVPTPEAINFQYSSSSTSRRFRPGRPSSTRSF